MQPSMSPPWYEPNPRTPDATATRSFAPLVATWRVASVDGGVTPWSIDATRAAANSLPMVGEGSSPRRIRYTHSPNVSRPMSSSSG